MKEQTFEDWVITDPSCNQMRKNISVKVFQFKEDRVNCPETKETYVYESIIDLESYPIDEIVSNCISFGYTEDEVILWVTHGENLALMAECMFEMEN